jgi:4'-phosphopantetheinyl transferase
MMDVYWLEQTASDLPADKDWLSASEISRLNGMRIPKRRDDWRLGRWTVKRAMAIYLDLPGHPQALTDIEVRPAQSGAPEVFVRNQPAPVTISLSHRGGTAACAIALPGVELGCDLEIGEPRGEAFIADYFTAEEQQSIEGTPSADRPLLLALLWSAKESALKALRAGLRLDTRSVIVRPGAGLPNEDERATFRPSSEDNIWFPLHVVCEGRQVFHGWWQNTGELMRTVVASPPPLPPTFLETPAHSAPAEGRSG